MIALLVLAVLIGLFLAARSVKPNGGRVHEVGEASASSSAERDAGFDEARLIYEVSYGAAGALGGPATKSSDCWIAPGEVAKVGTRRIVGGMLYVGKNLPAPDSLGGVDACLIDIDQPRADSDPDYFGDGMGYWPGYSRISPGCRSAYLDWLEGGRVDAEAYIGYVFLFLYGLERRLLHDAKADAVARRELPAIVAEVERLLSIYGENGSFHGYASNFLGFVRDGARGGEAPGEVEGYRRSYELPLDIRMAAGRLAHNAERLPADLAFAWATSEPEIRLRTAATRCKSEFEELFRLRYARKFDEGMMLPSCKRRVRAEYRPSSPSFRGSVSEDSDVPDVTSLVGPRRKLAGIVEEVTDALDPYSRRLGRDPLLSEPMSAAALLPPELVATHAPAQVRDLLRQLQGRASSGKVELLSAAEVVGLWPTDVHGRLSKKDSVAAATLLSHAGVGMEPDFRFGGPKLDSNAEIAIFSLGEADPDAPSAAFAAASLLLHLAAQVSAADGEVSIDEEQELQMHVSKSLNLEDGEQRRLSAHIAWLLKNPPGMAGVKKRVEALSNDQREAIGGFLIGVAAADGRIEPSEVSTLTKLFKVLGLDPARVHTDLHARQSGSSATEGPVSVRSAKPGRQGTPIPPRTSTEEQPIEASRGLDLAAIEAKLQESASVSALLSSIFVEDDKPTNGPGIPEPSPEGGEDWVIDQAHTELLRELASRAEIPRGEYEGLAEKLGLMPDGALESLNELAWESCDTPLAEDGDIIEIDSEICRVLLKS